MTRQDSLVISNGAGSPCHPVTRAPTSSHARNSPEFTLPWNRINEKNVSTPIEPFAPSPSLSTPRWRR